MRRVRRLPLEELAPALLPTPEPGTVLAWPAVFGNDGPVEIEVGFGKGLFLLTAALARPQVNFLGIEILRKYQLFTATRLVKRGVGNVRLACADAREFLRGHVAAGSVAALHVYFPDPWWKKRHRKRRLFTPEFAQECERVLVPGGILYVVTDVEEYFVEIRELVAGHTAFHVVANPAAPEGSHDLDYLTNFERKFRKEGRPIYRVTYQR